MGIEPKLAAEVFNYHGKVFAITTAAVPGFLRGVPAITEITAIANKTINDAADVGWLSAERGDLVELGFALASEEAASGGGFIGDRSSDKKAESKEDGKDAKHVAEEF